MAKLTKEQRAELEARLAEDDSADDDDEYELGFADGSYVRGRHSRISKIAAARGIKLEADEPAEGDDGKPKPSNVRPAHFGGQRTKRNA